RDDLLAYEFLVAYVGNFLNPIERARIRDLLVGFRRFDQHDHFSRLHVVALVHVYGLHVAGDLCVNRSLGVAVNASRKLDRPRRSAAGNLRYQHTWSERDGLSEFRRLELEEFLARQYESRREAEGAKHRHEQDDHEPAPGLTLIATVF